MSSFLPLSVSATIRPGFAAYCPRADATPIRAQHIEREYLPWMARLGLPAYQFPPVPKELMTAARATEIEQEILQASPSVLVTFRDQPLKWFASRYRAHPKLETYDGSEHEYYRHHDIAIGGRRMKLLPLVHPRQAGQLEATRRNGAGFT